MRVASRAVVTLLLAIPLTAFVGGAAGASGVADPTPSPTADGRLLTFHGLGFSTDGTGDTPLNNGITVTVDCRSGTCLFSMIADEKAPDGSTFFLSGATPLALVNGQGTFDLPAFGTPCNDNVLGASHLTVERNGTGLHIAQSVAEADYPCGDYGAGSFALDAALVSGDVCYLDHSCPTPTPTPTPVAAGAVRSGSTTPGSHAPAPDQPSVLSTLPTVPTAFTVPNLVWAVSGTVVLVLLIAFPSYLLDSASERGAERLAAWWKRRRPWPERAPATAASPQSTRAIAWRTLPLAVVGVLAASLISSFIDPSFGFSLAGIRVFLSFFASFLFDAVAAWFLLIWFVRRSNPETRASFRFAPASLIVVAIAVLFTRLTGFQPGIVFGLVAGVAFGSVLADTVKARVALIGLSYSFVLGLVGWFSYSALVGASGAHPSTLVVFFEELLAAMAIGGIAALPISLIPLRGLLGGEIFAWKRWVWAVAYALGLLAFFLVLMPKPFSWATVGISVWAWGGLFAAYAIVAIVLWLALTIPWKREPSDEPLIADEEFAV